MKEKNTVTVKEVREVIRALGFALGLVEESQESSLETFVRRFRDMGLADAYSIVQSSILKTNYIESFSEEHLTEWVQLFPYRSKEDVKAKLMRTESIRVAVAILIVAKHNPDMVYRDWFHILTFLDLFKEVNPYDLEIRLEALLKYLGK